MEQKTSLGTEDRINCPVVEDIIAEFLLTGCLHDLSSRLEGHCVGDLRSTDSHSECAERIAWLCEKINESEAGELEHEVENEALAMDDVSRGTIETGGDGFLMVSEEERFSWLIDLWREALKLTKASKEDCLAVLENFVAALVSHFKLSGRKSDLDEAITTLRGCRSPTATTDSNADQSTLLSLLAACLQSRYESFGDFIDIDEAVGLRQSILESCSNPDDRRASALSNCAAAFQVRFDESNDLDDLEHAIAFEKEALQLRPKLHRHHPLSLHNLAAAYEKRFLLSGDPSDIDAAISNLEHVLLIWTESHPNRSNSLASLANAHRLRFEVSSVIADLNVAVALYENALHLESPGLGRPSPLFNNLAIVLLTRFENAGAQADMDRAVELRYTDLAQISQDDIERPDVLSNLGATFYETFQTSGNLQLLEQALSFYREGLCAPSLRQAIRATLSNNFATALHAHFRYTNNPQELDEAIALHRKVLGLWLKSHPDRPSSLLNLAEAFVAKFEISLSLLDIDEAISHLREAQTLCHRDNPSRSGVLNTLGCALSMRYDYSVEHTMAELVEASSVLQEALELRPEPHPDRVSTLHTQAFLMIQTFDRSQALCDLDAAIALESESLRLQRELGTASPASLNNLALYRMQRLYHADHALSDVDEVILLHRETLRLLESSPDSVDGVIGLHNLASAYWRRYELSGEDNDILESIRQYQFVLDKLPEGHSFRAMALGGLSAALMRVYRKGKSPDHLDRAITALRETTECHTSPVQMRFDAALEWINIAATEKHASELHAHEAAIHLLHRLTWFGLGIRSRLEVLKDHSSNLTRNAAACALRLGKLEKAVEMLEEGRSILWNQSIQLRTPFDDLMDVMPETASRLRDISRMLERGGFQYSARTLSDSPDVVTSIEAQAKQQRLLNDEWQKLVEQVRKHKRFHPFLRPLPFTELVKAAEHGAIVLINCAEDRTDALILWSGGVRHVPLPSMSASIAKELATAIRASHSPSLPAVRNELRKMKKGSVPMNSTETVFRRVLKTLWRCIGQPILHSLGFDQRKDDTNAPRLWWLLTGPLLFLPMHAAGAYDNDSPISIMDYVISSYAFSLRSLLRNGRDLPSETQIAVVAQQNTPGQRPLNYTVKEMQIIEKLAAVKPEVFSVKTLVGEDATPTSVSMTLPSVRILHLACHALQDTADPLSSAILVHKSDGDSDGRLTVLHIMKNVSENARLVFLSACQTGMGDDVLPDESIHLAAAMLSAGFQSAVGTLWSMQDADGPVIAEAFYEDLFSKPPRSIEASARALHRAVSHLRRQPGISFVRWVPFVHFGL